MATTETSSDEATATLSRIVLLLSVLIVVNMSVLGLKRKFAQKSPRLANLVPDATLTTIVGLGAGAVLQYCGKSGTLTTLGNSYESLFMIVMLPPIIFESTINIHKENFYKNIGSILIFAIFGTAIAIGITSIGLYYLDKIYLNTQYFTLWECFTFGALISSTDPVSVLAVFKEMNADKMLYSLIYGESMLNDAISISSYNTFALIAEGKASTDYIGPLLNFLSIFLGSLIVGVIIAILCALIIKNFLSTHKDPSKETYSEHDHEQSTETILMVLVPWIAYLIGEGFGLSGIVSILFCGITINRYAFPNMSHDAQRLTSKIYHVLGSTFENAVFIFIGIGFFSFEHDWENLGWKFFALTVILITVARFIQIYFLATFLNFFRTKSKITSNFKAIMANSGFRGAMSFALSTSAVNTFTSDNSGKAMLSITLVYISLSTFIMGTILVPLCEYYDVREKPQDDSTLDNTTFNTQEAQGESQYCWNRMKSGFGAVDTVLCSYLIETKEGELDLDSFDYKPTGNDSPTNTKRVAFLSVQPQTHQELVPVGKSPSVTRVV